MTTIYRTLGTAAVLLATVAAAVGSDEVSEDWPQWRGPKADGRPTVTGIKRDWSGGLTKLWAVTDICKGKNSAAWSAPSLKGDRLVITGRYSDKDVVFCLNPDTGALVWKKAYAAPGKCQYGTGPRATPTIDGDRVYTFGCMGHLACWRLADGAQVWMKKVEALGGKRPYWGHSSSPLIWKKTVIVQAGGKALVLALDKMTGKPVWKSMTGKAGYAAPVIATVAGKPQLIVFTDSLLVGLDPDDGRRLWSHVHKTAFGMNCTTPIVLGERLLVSSSEYGKQGGTALLKLRPNGVTPVWRTQALGAAHNDPVVVDGHIYAYTGWSFNPKELKCLDLATGAVRWATAAAGGPGNVVLVDGLLLCLDNRGRLSLAKPSPKAFTRITQFQAITGHPVWTGPVIVRDRIYVRFANTLICYRLKDTPAPK